MAKTKVRVISKSSLKKATPRERLNNIRRKFKRSNKRLGQSKLAKLLEVVTNSKLFRPLRKMASFFKGAFGELRQVHWPDRKASRNLTIAVLAFAAIFVVIIILLDFGFNKLFEFIIKRN